MMVPRCRTCHDVINATFWSGRKGAVETKFGGLLFQKREIKEDRMKRKLSSHLYSPFYEISNNMAIMRTCELGVETSFSMKGTACVESIVSLP